jgi:two-component system nitrogen regulation sensor histidine kinase NtrY
VARTDIRFAFAADDEVGLVACDRHQFGQAITNVLKNAVEAIDARAKSEDGDYNGAVSVQVTQSDTLIEVAVTDNGIGLPQDRERIVEPYVTTREKGTGLGLAIVNKIIEEHGGEMNFATAETGGTRVTMSFARDPLSDKASSEAAE